MTAINKSEELIIYLQVLGKTRAFKDFDFADINTTNAEGQNALYMAVLDGEVEIARELITLGIEVNPRGAYDRIPLHEAALKGDMALVELLVENGADLFALDEGITPLTLAQYSNNDEICDYLERKMNQTQQADRSTWIAARISRLEREIERLRQKK